MRTQWTCLSDEALLAQCAVDTYRARGPGGQKRNKTSSAVRLRHPPSGLSVIAEESRSQHENRLRALRRLRQALYLQIREAVPAEQLTPQGLAVYKELEAARDACGRLRLSAKDPRFWPAAARVLDVLAALQGQVRATAQALGTSTGNLLAFLQTHPKLWEQANQVRRQFGRPPLRLSK